MTCAASGPEPGAGPGGRRGRPDAERLADPRAAHGRAGLLPAGPCGAGHGGRCGQLGPRDVLGVAWAAGPAATADPLTLRKSGFRGLFSRPAAK